MVSFADVNTCGNAFTTTFTESILKQPCASTTVTMYCALDEGETSCVDALPPLFQK